MNIGEANIKAVSVESKHLFFLVAEILVLYSDDYRQNLLTHWKTDLRCDKGNMSTGTLPSLRM